MMSENDQINLIKEHLKSYKDFPKQGVVFQDIFSVLQNPKIANVLYDVLLNKAKSIKPPVECIAGVDSRGFLFGSVLARELEIPFIPIRKKGKLPGSTKSVHYKLEYKEDDLEMQEGVVREGQKVLVVDDLLATGGSLSAACELLSQAKADVQCLVVIELSELQGRKIINVPIHSLIVC
ncbi:hypothetical protein RN001_000579 [Aquatica leii]|uniref:Adenine phosphoribosyltransferase n=1 Tax=Aquatica leii TaxID=1421715 RepID=A0AAN7SQL1_9COLE|nr:hypothetical protein RN001_000579 [Aquatica leii]